MPSICIIALDNTCARIFHSSSPKGPLEEKNLLVHPENRFHDQNLTSDRQGYSFSSHGYGRKALSKSETLKEHEIKQFVKEVSEYLKISEANNEFEQLIIIAGPKLLGALKKQLNNNLRKLITYELKKNIAKLSAAEIRKHLPKYLTQLNL